MSIAIAPLLVTLDHVEPPVTRRLEVPLDLRLDRLHLVLQEAMPWENYHLWEFHVRDVRWGPHQADWEDGPRNAAKATLRDALGELGSRKTFRYLYDFGDGWEHTIKVGAPRDADPGARYPRLVEAAGRCPPEDVGGPWGYEELLDAVAEPSHDRHGELTEWAGGPFDPMAAPVERLRVAVARLASRWARRPRAKKAEPETS